MSSSIHPAFERTRIPAGPLRDPLLRALVAFAIAGAWGVVAAQLWAGSHESLGLVALIATGVAVVAGILVLGKSTAIRRIWQLRLRNRALLDQVTRSQLYSDQLGETLESVARYRRDGRSSDVIPLCQRSMDGAVARASAVVSSPVRMYLVHSTPHTHSVKAAAGEARFGIEAGKSCPADRPLAEILPTLGRHWHVAECTVGGARHALVLIADRPLARVDEVLVDHMALAITLAGEPPLNESRRPMLRAIRPVPNASDGAS